jgi:hypothetical protein
LNALRCLRVFAAVLPALAGTLAAGCSTVDLGDPPADVNACRPSQDFFANGGLWDMFLDKDYGGKHCKDAACHGDGAGRPLSLKIPEPGTPVPLPLPANWMANYISATEQMQCSNVHSSPLLANPAGIVTHGGGKLIQPDGPEATLIEMWVTAP